MRPTSLSLGLKFSLAVTLLIILAMLGVATLILNYQKDALRQGIFDSNVAMTINLAHDAAEPLLVFDPLRLDELVKTLREASACRYAMVIDREGQIVAHTERARIGSRLPEFKSDGNTAEVAAAAPQMLEYESERVEEFSHPIAIGNEVLGIAKVAYSVKSINATIDQRLGSLRNYIYLITGLVLLTGIAGAFLVSHFLTKPLKRLKDRMLVVQTGNLDVEVENPRLVKCWERLNCEKSDCPSYGRLRCWATAGTFCQGKVQGAFAQKIGDCRKCVVYRESCGDEINELVEVFNQMLKDLKHNLAKLEAANSERARLERLSALGEMASTVAHETKNPLNAIKIATAYLKNNFEGEILKEFLTIIEEEVTRLNEISSNFLGFSKPAPLVLRPCSINAIVETTVDLIRQEATEKNVEIIVLKEENLPPVACDISRIKQALLNLLINALDVSREGDTISIYTEAVNSSIQVVIQDTGTGIREEDIGSIFKPFFTTKTRGSGLGLAIVERVVRDHGGHIEVDSVAGKGTKFTITIKMADEYAST